MLRLMFLYEYMNLWAISQNLKLQPRERFIFYGRRGGGVERQSQYPKVKSIKVAFNNILLQTFKEIVSINFKYSP